MSNTIEYLLSRIYREIPEQILNLAFGSTTYQYQLNRTSLDASIRGSVIDGIMLPDCNIVSSNIIEVPLSGLNWIYRDEGVLIRIPMSLTNNREIISVLSVEMVNKGMEGYPTSAGQPAGTGTPEVYLVGPNTVFISMYSGLINIHLRCSVANDANLNGFPQRALLDLGNLAVLAAKMFIYNKLAININVISMTGGAVDGQLRSIVDGYADAGEIYQDMLRTRIRKLSLMSDPKFHQRLIHMGIPR